MKPDESRITSLGSRPKEGTPGRLHPPLNDSHTDTDGTVVIVREVPLGQDSVATALAPRTVVKALHQLGSPVTIDQLADELLDVTFDSPEDIELNVWSDTHELLYKNLLPALDSAGLLQFHQSTGIVDLPYNRERRSSPR